MIIIFNLQNLRVNAPGTYELQLLANGKTIASRLIEIKELRAPKQPPQK